MTIMQLHELFLRCGGRINTDSRTVRPGEMFVALRGENFDGNSFALQALEKGAAYAVVDADSKAARTDDDKIIRVDETLAFLRALSLYHRYHLRPDGSHLEVIGLTGTNGKTTTKELLTAVLSCKYSVCATKGNLNNDIGVPRTLLSMDADTELAIVEMGANHPDDIARLVEIVQPDYGLITNVGKAHLLGFGSFDGVRKAKGQLYDWLEAHGGTAFVNAEDPVLEEMALARPGMKRICYDASSYKVEILPGSADNPFLSMKVDGVTVQTRLVGQYNAANVLSAIAVGRQFGVSLEDAAAAIAAYEPANSRSQMVRTNRNSLIVDAYNANPSSMAVALDNFISLDSPNKLALLGDMRELGEDALKEHIALVRKLSESRVPAMLVGEEFGKALVSTGISMPHFKDSEALAGELSSHPVSGQLILVKGSRGIMMENVIPQL